VTRLVALSLLNFVRNPLRQAVLYPWVILTVERWAEQTYQIPVPNVPGAYLAGKVAVGVGAVLCLMTIVQFVVDGGGTAEGYAHPTTLITGGVFRWTRNPLYLGKAMVQLGEAAAAASEPLLLYAFYWCREFSQRVRREETMLLGRYDDAYLSYAEFTPRWLPLIPAQLGISRAVTPHVSLPRAAVARRRQRSLDAARKLQQNSLRAGLILTSLAIVGYLNSVMTFFSPSNTPFLWFDPVENLFHLVLGATLFVAAGIPGARQVSASPSRPLLAAVGTVLVVAAVAGFLAAGRPAPNILGKMNFENPVENVIHWVLGVQCLLAAARRVLLSRAQPRKEPSPALSS
jgi:protein-S-isoprenylcysteine O-methyltransferase Ste14